MLCVGTAVECWSVSWFVELGRVNACGFASFEANIAAPSLVPRSITTTSEDWADPGVCQPLSPLRIINDMVK
jgi:hypothetical protein